MLAESQKRKIRKVAKEHGVEAALEFANELLQGRGIWCIWGFAGILNTPDILYVNLGDPHTPTVMYDRVTRRFRWGERVGAIVERRGYHLWRDMLGREDGPYYY